MYTDLDIGVSEAIDWFGICETVGIMTWNCKRARSNAPGKGPQERRSSEQIPIADQLSNLTNGFCWIPCAETAKETE